MQIVENLSEIRGRIVNRIPSSERPGWQDVTVRLERAEKIDERAELLSQFVGQEIVIGLPDNLAEGATTGAVLETPAKIAGPGRILAAPQAAPTARFAISTDD